MAYIVGINKNMKEMFGDLETLMFQEGWEKLSRNTLGSFTSSRGYKYTVGGHAPEAYPGRYSDTIAIKLHPDSSFTHSSVPAAAPDTFYNDYPTEFSISFWLNLSERRSAKIGSSSMTAFMRGFATSATLRRSPKILLDTECSIGEYDLPVNSLMHLINTRATDPRGKCWSLFTMVYSNLAKTITYYMNDTLIVETPFPFEWTYYGAIYQIYGDYQSKIIDELIVWNKCLLPEDILALYNRTTSVPSSTPYVFEKFTEDIGVLYGGVYKTIATDGVKIMASITYNTSNNIEFLTPTFYSSPLSFTSDYAVVNTVGQESAPRCMAGVGPTSTTLKKYWLVVNRDRVIIAYKLHDPSSVRTTPLYQLGYIGKLKSLGNDGNSIFSTGTTGTNKTYLWTTINAGSFRSGVMYSSNNAVRLNGSYYNAGVGSINTTLSSLYSINNTAFLAGINVSYSSWALGSFDGVFAVAHTQALAEDLITVNTVDYVVLPDADAGVGVYNLALKLY